MSLILTVLALLFPFLNKYSFVTTNQFSQIPIILSFLDPKYLSNDWYVSVSRYFGPRTFFAWYMAQTVKLTSLPITFFIHYLIYTLLIVFSTYRLSYLLFKNKFIALTTVICVLFGTSITVGGNILVTADFSASQLPLGLTLMGITLLLEKKYIFSSLFFIISSFLHPLIGFEIPILFFTSYFLTQVVLSNTFSSFLKKAVAPYILFSLPPFFLYIKEGTKNAIPVSDRINILAYMRNSHHFIASTWPISEFVFFIIFFLIFTFVLIKLKKTIKKEYFLLIFLTSFFIIISCFIGYVGIELVPIYILTALQPYRLTLYTYWLGVIIVLGGSLYYLLYKKPKYSPIFLLPLFLSNLQIVHLNEKANILALGVAIFLSIFFKRIPRNLFIFLLISYFTLLRFHERINLSSYILHPTDETSIAIWVKNNTPSDAVFLTPPEFESFRLIANRAIVADWKSFPFQEMAMEEWAKRMCVMANIHNCNYKNTKYENVVSGYRSHTKESLMKLSDQYHFSYIISDKEIAGLRKIYGNRFNVYLISK